MLRRMLQSFTALMVAAFSGTAMAGMLTTTAIADTGIGDGVSVSRNSGARDRGYVGNAGANFKSLFEFSIAAIPANQTIDSATLKLTFVESGGTLGTVDLRRLLVSWVEGIGTNLNGYGTYGVTWTDRDKDPALGALPNWTTAGAAGDGTDRLATATATVNANATSGILSIDVTGDVQLWYSGLASNFGWLLESTSPVANGTYRAFATKEHATASFWPTLEVNYSPVPEPSSMIIACWGIFGAMFIRSRGRRFAR